jgi:hypothetical protein
VAPLTAEEQRLFSDPSRRNPWRRWGPYLTARQWGTVREDYSPDGDAWNYLPFTAAASRTYRWGEDGLLGFCDDQQLLCFAPALWNGADRILKERLFGLSGPQGNHGEDVKEYYYYLDGVPTHSLVKALYKYPQGAFPYGQLLSVNRGRTRLDPEYELIDTGVFNEDRYFDVTVEYAKATPEDICIEITAVNRGPQSAKLHVLPTLWFRNTWVWDGLPSTGSLSVERDDAERCIVAATHPQLGNRWLYGPGGAALLFTDNETNGERVFNTPKQTPYTKDGIEDYVVNGIAAAVNPAQIGTKASLHYRLDIPSGATRTIRLRFADAVDIADPIGADFDAVFAQRRADADEFYAHIAPYPQSDEARAIQRAAFAGLLQCEQFYHYIVYRWLDGDREGPVSAPERKRGRNHEWPHLYSTDILSMCDNWEYPWFAAWDLAFHCITLSMIDPDFAKRQLALLTREWYMHPNGQLPAYEWNFSDVNPPVHAWAALRVYRIEHKMFGRYDRMFLERVFQKLLLYFTWWCNRKDAEGNNVFQGGFLGLDNIGVFDRNAMLPSGAHLDQADGTAWMGMFCLNMLAIALELAQTNHAYEDIASKFFEHFLFIADSLNHIGGEHKDDVDDIALWDPETGFYYDVLHEPGKEHQQLKLRSMVGLIPMFAVEVADPGQLDNVPDFKRRMEWFIRNRPDLHGNLARLDMAGHNGRRLLSLVNKRRLHALLQKMLDESEFLSPHGVRSLSKYHEQHPYTLEAGGGTYVVGYEPAESKSGLFGGNSNWRGPVWFPTNYLIIESLQKFHYYYGDDFMIEYPTGSGTKMNLWDVSTELSHRLIDLFKRGPDGRRPMYGDVEKFQRDPHFRDLFLFYEYFHGDTGAGLGASHQTGWTALVAKLLQQCAEYCGQEKEPL